MVSEGGHLTSEGAEHTQLCGLGVVNGLHQSTHGKIARIQNKGIGIFFPGFVNQGFDAGKTAHLGSLPVFYGEKAV